MTIRENVYSANGWDLLSTFLCYEAMALLFSSPIVLAATWGNMQHTQIAFAGVGVAALPFCLILAWSHNRYLQKRGGFVELEDDTLHYFEHENEPPVYSAPLEKCLWFEGYRTWATLPRQDGLVSFQIADWRRVIILQFPDWLHIPERKSGRVTIAEQPVIVAVGQSQKTRKQWAFALENTEIACDTTRHRRWLSPISHGLIACWSLCWGITLFFVLLPRMSRGITGFLNNWNVHADVAEAIGFSLFFPGLVFVLVWICVFPILWINRIIGVEKVKWTWYELAMSGIAILSVILFRVWLSNFKTFEWRMAYTISLIVMCVVTFACWWLLVRTPKRHEPDIME